MAKRLASACSASVSTLPKRSCGSTFAAAAAKAGAIWRHGPHHPAQKSIRSGMSLEVACFSKFAAFNSTGSPWNKVSPHLPQCPPSASLAAGRRLSVAHVGHAMTRRSPSVMVQPFLSSSIVKQPRRRLKTATFVRAPNRRQSTNKSWAEGVAPAWVPCRTEPSSRSRAA